MTTTNQYKLIELSFSCRNRTPEGDVCGSFSWYFSASYMDSNSRAINSLPLDLVNKIPLYLLDHTYSYITCRQCYRRSNQESVLSSKGFKKNDSGKLEWHLLPWTQVKEIIKVLMYGKIKYGEWNWQKCVSQKRYYNALLRHIEAYRSGESYDPETKLHHLAHAGCCLLFLFWLAVNKPEETNDLQPKKGNSDGPRE